MANDTVTLALSGEVELGDFAHAVRALDSLLTAIPKERPSIGKLRWVVDDLQTSSAIARMRGVGKNVTLAVDEYQRVGDSAANDQLSQPGLIKDAVVDLTKVIGQSVKSVRFETYDHDAEIFKPVPPNPIATIGLNDKPPHVIPPSFGSVSGKIQSISKHKSLQFTIYDVHTDAAISCYLEPGNEDVMRKMWGKLAVVSGIVRRNPISGEPTTVRRVKAADIKVIRELRGSGGWRDAIGAVRHRKGQISSEAAIRRGRDG